MSSPSPDAPSLPQLPDVHKLRVFILAGVWCVVGALTPAVATVWDDWLHNEFTDWPKLERTSGMMAGLAAIAYWRKYAAWLKAPPGTELVQKTVSIESGGGEPSKITVKTETVDVQQKADVK